jgi:hypothetical protein
VVYATSSQRSHGSEAKDDRFNGVSFDVVEVRTNYHSLDVFFSFKP